MCRISNENVKFPVSQVAWTSASYAVPWQDVAFIDTNVLWQVRVINFILLRMFLVIIALRPRHEVIVGWQARVAWASGALQLYGLALLGGKRVLLGCRGLLRLYGLALQPAYATDCGLV